MGPFLVQLVKRYDRLFLAVFGAGDGLKQIGRLSLDENVKIERS